ncbi:GNAT family N-acetyltransferase [Aeromicrobium sp.]|uniref:GNAT family N-acetyltransferase n=1 Tax=Aeromicrobium sp. TaxID=1871063 RepID=UPI003C3E6D67
MLTYDLRAVPYGSADPQLLTAEVQAEYARRYGGKGDIAPIDTAEFDGEQGEFFVVYVDDAPVAMGGWRRHGEDGDGEIKRMYVRPSHQRRGLARVVLAHLEATAVAAGISRLILETGLAQPEAIAMYRSAGYTDIPAFGFYAADPLSVHLGKVLAGHRLTS